MLGNTLVLIPDVRECVPGMKASGLILIVGIPDDIMKFCGENGVLAAAVCGLISVDS